MSPRQRRTNAWRKVTSPACRGLKRLRSGRRRSTAASSGRSSAGSTDGTDDRARRDRMVQCGADVLAATADAMGRAQDRAPDRGHQGQRLSDARTQVGTCRAPSLRVLSSTAAPGRARPPWLSGDLALAVERGEFGLGMLPGADRRLWLPQSGARTGFYSPIKYRDSFALKRGPRFLSGLPRPARPLRRRYAQRGKGPKMKTRSRKDREKMNAALSVALRAWSAAKDGDLVDLVRRLNLGCVMAYPPLCPAAAFGCSLPRLPSARPGRELV